MSTQVQVRRGTRAQGLAFTGAVGEASLDTDRGAKSGSRWRLHDGVAAGGNLQAAIVDLQEMEGVYGSVEQGGSPASPDELLLTHTEPILGYIEGLQIAWKQPANNGGSVQINVDDKGFRDLKKNDPSGTPAAVSADDLFENGIYTAIYDGARFILGAGIGGVAIIEGTNLLQDPIAVNSSVTQAHGLGVRPNFVIVELENKTAQLGWTPGELVLMDAASIDADGGTRRLWSITTDDTNIELRTRTTMPSDITLIRKDNKVPGVITLTSWKLRIRPISWE